MVSLCRFTASGEIDLINFIYVRLCDEACQPDQLMAVLAQFFGEGLFVLVSLLILFFYFNLCV